MVDAGTTPFRMLAQIRDTTRCLVEALGDENRTTVRNLVKEMYGTGARNLYASGCGTSTHAADYARYAFRELAGVNLQSMPSFDLLHYEPHGLDQAGVLTYSHSGATKCTVDAAAKARESARFVVALTNIPNKPLSDAATHTVLVPGGRDNALAKTKSFTTTMLTNLLLALEWGSVSGYLTDDIRNEWEHLLTRIPAWVDTVIKEVEPIIEAQADRLAKVGHWLFVGPGPSSVIAREIALKMKETCYVVAEGYDSEEAAHGRLQPLDSRYTVVALEGGSPRDRRVLDIVLAARLIAAQVMGVVHDKASAVAVAADFSITVPDVHRELLSAIVNVIPGQFLAYYGATARGYNPDVIREDDPRYGAVASMVFPPGTH